MADLGVNVREQKSSSLARWARQWLISAFQANRFKNNRWDSLKNYLEWSKNISIAYFFCEMLKFQLTTPFNTCRLIFRYKANYLCHVFSFKLSIGRKKFACFSANYQVDNYNMNFRPQMEAARLFPWLYLGLL